MSERFDILTPLTCLDDRYEIIRLIGQGGFAHVYEAQDVKLGQVVALKVLYRTSSSLEEASRYLERFEREIKYMARLEHPDILRLLDVGVYNGQPYFVMARLDGSALHHILQQSGGIAPARVHRLFGRALHALAHAHQQGLVHRDIKPSNLFVAYPHSHVETLKILDFGIAFEVSLYERRLTLTGEYIGTPDFSSPEYAAYREISPGLDVYQMGLVLGHMLTGSPLTGQNVLQRFLDGAPLEDVKLPPSLEQGPWREVLHKSLHRDPSARYQDAWEMFEAFQHIDPTTLDLPVKEGAPQGASSNQSQWLLGALVVVMLVVLATGVMALIAAQHLLIKPKDAVVPIIELQHEPSKLVTTQPSPSQVHPRETPPTTVAKRRKTRKPSKNVKKVSKPNDTSKTSRPTLEKSLRHQINRNIDDELGKHLN